MVTGLAVPFAGGTGLLAGAISAGSGNDAI
jgi:hypothetical protein